MKGLIGKMKDEAKRLLKEGEAAIPGDVPKVQGMHIRHIYQTYTQGIHIRHMYKIYI